MAAVRVGVGGYMPCGSYCPTTTRGGSKTVVTKAMQMPCSSIGGGATSLRLALPQRSIRAAVRSKRHIVPCYQRQEASASSPAQQNEAKSMEEVYETLAEHLFSILKNIEHLDSKYIVGIAGPPGAGKSTVASEVVQRVNKRWSQKNDNGSSLISIEIATMLPMDGFHLYRSQLDAMEDPKEAHARRGAPWTFDPSRFLKCLQTLREEGSVYAPSFDHGVGDPVENDIFVKPQHKIVIVEGNYLLLEEDVWREIGALFDEKWRVCWLYNNNNRSCHEPMKLAQQNMPFIGQFIDIDIDVSMQRVFKRHVATGKEPDVAAWRISYNDRPNAELIMKSKKTADLVIRSVDLSS